MSRGVEGCRVGTGCRGVELVSRFGVEVSRPGLSPRRWVLRSRTAWGARPRAVRVWFKLCCTTQSERGSIRVRVPWLFLGWAWWWCGVCVCVVGWWSSARDACLSLIARHAPLAIAYLLSPVRRASTDDTAACLDLQTTDGARSTESNRVKKADKLAIISTHWPPARAFLGPLLPSSTVPHAQQSAVISNSY